MTVSPRLLTDPTLVIEPTNEKDFITTLDSVANPRQKTLLVEDIKQSVISARHKLNIVMYQAALLSEINTDDFHRLKVAADENRLPMSTSHVEYKGCSYDLRDFYHYRLMLSFFVESFAAANFSLFDVIGRLVNDLYSLGKTRTSYKGAVEDLKKRKGSNPDAVMQLLHRHHAGLNDPHMPTWLLPLEELRNRTTHRLITDICYIRSEMPLYPESAKSAAAFYLNRNLFSTPSGSAPTDVLLSQFAEQVFIDIQSFIEELYDLLRQAIVHQGSLPLS